MKLVLLRKYEDYAKVRGIMNKTDATVITRTYRILKQGTSIILICTRILLYYNIGYMSPNSRWFLDTQLLQFQSRTRNFVFDTIILIFVKICLKGFLAGTQAMKIMRLGLIS